MNIYYLHNHSEYDIYLGVKELIHPLISWVKYSSERFTPEAKSDWWMSAKWAVRDELYVIVEK
jgi:hypothetical protein